MASQVDYRLNQATPVIQEASAYPTTQASVQECLSTIEQRLAGCFEQVGRIQGVGIAEKMPDGNGIFVTVDRISRMVDALQSDLRTIADRLGSL